jgi:hypothetical protein
MHYYVIGLHWNAELSPFFAFFSCLTLDKSQLRNAFSANLRRRACEKWPCKIDCFLLEISHFESSNFKSGAAVRSVQIMLRDLLTQIACNKIPPLTWYAPEHVDSGKRKIKIAQLFKKT